VLTGVTLTNSQTSDKTRLTVQVISIGSTDRHPVHEDIGSPTRKGNTTMTFDFSFDRADVLDRARRVGPQPSGATTPMSALDACRREWPGAPSSEPPTLAIALDAAVDIRDSE